MVETALTKEASSWISDQTVLSKLERVLLYLNRHLSPPKKKKNAEPDSLSLLTLHSPPLFLDLM